VSDDGSGAIARVLVAEDDADLRYILQLLLEEEGYQIATATGLDEALAQIDTQTFALVLTDLFAKMPQNPLGSAQVLLRHAHPTPVAVMTGWRLSAEEVERQGFRFLVPKPFDLDEMLALVKAAVHPRLTVEQRRQTQVVDGLFAAVAARDWDALAQLCVEDVTYSPPGDGGVSATLTGRQAFIGYVQESLRTVTAAHFDEVAIYPLPTGIGSRYIATWLDLDNAERRLSGGALFQFEHDRIAQIGMLINEDRLHALLDGWHMLRGEGAHQKS
jgi:CheY-like chemotaxis protein